MPYIVRSTEIVAATAQTYGPRVVIWSDLEQRIGRSHARLARSAEILDAASTLLDQTMTRIDRIWSPQPRLTMRRRPSVARPPTTPR